MIASICFAAVILAAITYLASSRLRHDGTGGPGNPLEHLPAKSDSSLADTVPTPTRGQAPRQVLPLLLAMVALGSVAGCIKQDGRVRLTPEGEQIAAESGLLALDIAARLGEHLIERLATTGTAGTAADWKKIALDLVPESGPRVLAQIIRAAQAQWNADHQAGASGVSRASLASSPGSGTRLERHSAIGFRPDTTDPTPAAGVVLDDERVGEALRYLATVYR